MSKTAGQGPTSAELKRFSDNTELIIKYILSHTSNLRDTVGKIEHNRFSNAIYSIYFALLDIRAIEIRQFVIFIFYEQ